MNRKCGAHAQSVFTMAADWKEVGSKVREEHADDRNIFCTDEVGVSGEDRKMVQKRATRKQFQDLSFRDSGKRVFVNKDPQSQRGRESQNALRTPRPGEAETGGRNSSPDNKLPSKRAEAGGVEPVVWTTQGGPGGEPAQRPVAGKKGLLTKQLRTTPSKLTARKTGPDTTRRLPLPKGKGQFSARKRAPALPVRFDFRRSGQADAAQRQFSVRKLYPAEPKSVSGHSNAAQLASEKFSVTVLKPEPAQNGLPSNGDVKGSTTTETTPKRHLTARKSCTMPKNATHKATIPEGSHKKPHQVRFANQRSGSTAASQERKLKFDLNRSRKRNAAALAEALPVTKKLKSSAVVIPPAVQRAIMLGLVTTSSVRPGMKAGIPLDCDTILTKTQPPPLAHKLSPQTNTSNEAQIGVERSAPDIRSSSLAEQVERMKRSGTADADVMGSPDANDQDVFMNDDPPELTSSVDLEAQDLSSSDDSPELDNQPPPDITSVEPLHQTAPPGGEAQSSDRDNPTPTPGTTASSSNPRHALPADFPVGAAGSATPDSSATEACPSDALKKKRRPRTHTHFGMKRHRVVRTPNKLNSYDSDSTDVQSEAGSEIPPPSQSKRSNSSSTLASLESEVDYLAQGNLVDHNNSSHHLQSELPLCCCRMEQNGPSSVSLSICRALEVIDSELVECKNKINTCQLHRPSSRVPYGAFCSDHRTQMTEHKCCPGCGCFCTTGVVVVCNAEDNAKKSHHFHRECIVDLAGALYCPHCGNTAGLREMAIPPDEGATAAAALCRVPESKILSGVVRLPRSLLAKLTACRDKERALAAEAKESEKETGEHGPRAKMSVTKKDKPEPPAEDESYADLPSKSITLKSGTTLTSEPLPPGLKRDDLEAVMEYLNTESPKRCRFVPKSMYTAAGQGEMGKLLQMLAEGFDPNYRFPAHNQETALHSAAAGGHLDVIIMMLQAGANMEAEDEDHKTPLHMAVENGHNDCMRYLIKHGAVVEHKDDEGMTILHLASKSGNLEAVKYIMSLRKIYSNAQDDGGWTPIIWAAEYKHIPVVKYLIERGADPNIRDKEGNSGLHWAVFSGAEDVAEIFLRRHSDVHAPNVHGDTPLHIAAREDNYGCVTMLLLRNADIAVTNQEEETPLDCAQPNSDVALALQVNEKMKLATGNRTIRTEKIIGRDIARGLEALPITVVNAVNDDPIPTDFHYVAKSCETKPLDINHSIKNPPMCTCTNEDCSSGGCECANNSVQCWYDLDGRLFPDFDYHEPPLIFECGPGCKCWRTCRNRVVQNGIRCHLQLYRTAKIGWGVRVTQDIPQGTFICEYAGELISDAEADKREDDSYLFDLDNEEREVYCIDARYYGNISRFINHQCDPNLVPVRVFMEHRDISFPRIAFFASRDIKAQEELGFDYGDKFWAIKSKFFTCCCGSVHCKHAGGTSESSEDGDQGS